ncbi:MAG: hypothetical protein ACKO2G_02270 [Verrucomicrobiales bacterium]
MDRFYANGHESPPFPLKPLFPAQRPGRKALFSGFDPNSFLYLYVSHGHLGTNQSSHGVKFTGFGESGGFEEWSTFTDTLGNPPAVLVAPIPELSTSLMALIGTLVLALRRRRD